METTTMIPPDWVQVSGGAGASVEALAAWADQDPLPRFILTPEMTLVWASGAALRMLDEATVLHRTAGGVRLVDHHLHVQLSELVAQADHTLRSWHFSRHGGEGQLLFVARQVQGDNALVMLSVQDIGPGFQPRWADFSQAFGLTPAEHRVALMILDGLSVEAVAHQLGLGLATVRSHVKRLYLKLEVSSKEGMFRKMSGFRIL